MRERIGVRRIGSAAFESLFLWPMLVLVGALVLAPTIVAIFRSFYKWNPGFASPFVGLQNYGHIIHSGLIHQIARNELFYMLGVPLWAGVPLLIALLIYDGVPFPGLFRTIFFLPSVLSAVSIGILFRALLRPDGVLNSMLSSVGLGSLTHAWIDEPGSVKPVIILVVTWYSLGFGVLLYSAALAAVPPELFEAATVDGASWTQRLRYVMIPSILPMFLLNCIFNVGSVFLLFGYVYVLTQGGPGYSSTTVDYDIYNNATVFGQYGLAGAESTMLLGIMAMTLVAAVVVGKRMWKR